MAVPTWLKRALAELGMGGGLALTAFSTWYLLNGQVGRIVSEPMGVGLPIAGMATGVMAFTLSEAALLR